MDEPLRPARPRRRATSGDEAAATYAALLARIDELQEVMWSVVDTIAGLKDDVARIEQRLDAPPAAVPAPRAAKRPTVKAAPAPTPARRTRKKSAES